MGEKNDYKPKQKKENGREKGKKEKEKKEKGKGKTGKRNNRKKEGKKGKEIMYILYTHLKSSLRQRSLLPITATRQKLSNFSFS